MYRLLDLKLKPVSDQLRGQNLLHDYIVIKVVPGIIYSGDSCKLLTNQQIASVLSQLDESERNDESKKHRTF